MLEVEQKFWIDDALRLQDLLLSHGAIEGMAEDHCDRYFNHPSRDFSETSEALRIRRIDGIAHITYKGAKLPGSVKARTEMEWCLAPGDADGSLTEKLWITLGFRPVAIVSKQRRVFQCHAFGDDLTVTIDQVAEVGLFSEIELVVASENDVDRARARIVAVSRQLQLQRVESQSYLSLLLKQQLNRET